MSDDAQRPSWLTRLRFVPHLVALYAASILARRGGAAWPRRARDELGARGVAILIPERGTPDLLAETLAAARAALARIDEPGEIVVVVNGAPRGDYADLQRDYPEVCWLHSDQPLGFNGAVLKGLGAVTQPWTYLLNSDMRLHEDALRELLPYRQARVFALTSQIFFADPNARREETGWSDYHYDPQLPHVYEREPEGHDLARGTLYPGGGCSLCRTDVLRRYVRDSQVYTPFYWEDAEWGVRAWSEGFEVLFCPRSCATHRHRGTVKRYYAPEEVARVVRRNALQFDLRLGWTALSPRHLIGLICREPAATRHELASWSVVRGAFARRLEARRAQRRGLDFSILAPWKFYPKPRAEGPRPRVLLVTPFALFPPAHGGARRVTEWLRRLSERVDFILLGDERSLYDARSREWFDCFRAVHLVEGRGERPDDAPQDLLTRIARHAHPKLRAELRRLIAVYRPDVVQIEFMELAGLIDERQAEERWLLSLHDVYLDGGAHDAPQRELISRFDAVTVCSTEDQALLNLPTARLVPNGATDRLATYAPSGEDEILFMGPFRYAPNRDGIRAFLERAWPRLRARFPKLRLRILGGESAARDVADPLFRQDGVDLVMTFVDPTPLLARAALTINPQREIRGSALKVIESLLAGRACVTTRDGARGFVDADLDGLVITDDIDALGDAVAALLADPARRHALERADAARIAPFTWDGVADRQWQCYQELRGAR